MLVESRATLRKRPPIEYVRYAFTKGITETSRDLSIDESLFVYVLRAANQNEYSVSRCYYGELFLGQIDIDSTEGLVVHLFSTPGHNGRLRNKKV